MIKSNTVSSNLQNSRIGMKEAKPGIEQNIYSDLTQLGFQIKSYQCKSNKKEIHTNLCKSCQNMTINVKNNLLSLQGLNKVVRFLDADEW